MRHPYSVWFSLPATACVNGIDIEGPGPQTEQSISGAVCDRVLTEAARYCARRDVLSPVRCVG